MIVVTFESAIPCEEQAVRWKEAERDRYFALVVQADKETLISRHYTDSCLQDRNKYMVDNSSLCIAVTDGRPGGTTSTVRYAVRQKVQVALLCSVDDESGTNPKSIMSKFQK